MIQNLETLSFMSLSTQSEKRVPLNLNNVQILLGETISQLRKLSVLSHLNGDVIIKLNFLS